MSAAAVVTLIIVGLLVLAVAGFLVLVIASLGSVLSSLSTIGSAVRVIAERARPVGPALAKTNQELAALAEHLEEVLGTEVTERLTVAE